MRLAAIAREGRTDYRLEAETDIDLDFLGALDTWRPLAVVDREFTPSGPRSRMLTALELDVHGRSSAGSALQRDREFGRTLRQLLSLCLADLAEDGVSRTLAADPHPQEALAPEGVKLDLMSHAGRDGVIQHEFGREFVAGSHGSAPEVDQSLNVNPLGGAA